MARAAPQLQRVLNEALHAGGFFEAHEDQVRKARGRRDGRATLLAEETRMGMLVGVAVGLGAGAGTLADPDTGEK